MEYEVRYERGDGSFGVYHGSTKEFFEAEIEMCLRCGYEFTATAKSKID